MSDKYSEIEKAFREHSNRRVPSEKPEPGWFTAKDYAKAKGIGEREAQRHITELYSDGLLEVKKFVVKTGLRVYPVNHYRTCKKNKTA